MLQFVIPLQSIYSKNLCFDEQNMYFEHYIEVLTIKRLLIGIMFVKIFFSGDLFRAALYSLMSVLHKDALFHCLM